MKPVFPVFLRLVRFRVFQRTLRLPTQLLPPTFLKQWYGGDDGTNDQDFPVFLVSIDS